MRESDERNGRTGIFIRPRFCVWENVYGSLSSNGGGDFQRVLTEFARIADEECPDVPLPEKGGWSKSGILESEMGEWSIAWRLIDSKFWGVSIHTNGRVLNIGTPQRRKRVALVADFGGTSAGEILFERKSVCGDIAEGEQAWQEAAERTRSRLNGAGQSYTLKVRGGAERDRYGKRAGKGALIQDEMSATIGVSQDQTLIQIGTEGGRQRTCYDARGNGSGYLSPTITGDHQNRITDYTAIVLDEHGNKDVL